MDKGKAKNAAGVAKAKKEEEDDKGGCESEGESNDGSVEEEEDVSMPPIMDPSVLEESQDYKHEPTSVFTPGNNAYATAFASATPSTVISDSGAVTSYLQPGYLPISLDKLVNGNSLERSRRECRGQRTYLLDEASRAFRCSGNRDGFE